MKNWLSHFIDEEHIVGRCFAGVVQILVLISVLGFSLLTLPDQSETFRSSVWLVQYIILGIFTVEYLLRIWLAEDRLAYIVSAYGLIDLLAIAPFYIAGLADLSSIRALRIFRLFRLFKFARYSKAIDRFVATWNTVKHELVLMFVAGIILIYLASIGIYFFEHAAQPDVFRSVPHSFWWSIVTLFTVGYGDMVPITAGGRMFASCMILIGVGLVTTPAGLIAAGFLETANHAEPTDELPAPTG